MFCRKCGQKLSLRFCENEGLIPYCSSCADYIFPQFNVAVSMVVTNRAQDKILLAKHVDDEDFILFAGYMKKGENAEKTVPREIKEELGLNVVKAKYMSSRYYDKNDVLMLNFIVIVEEKEIKLNTNESPYKPSQSVIKAAKEQAEMLNLYSDPEIKGLTEQIAKLYGVLPSNVICTNGSDEA